MSLPIWLTLIPAILIVWMIFIFNRLVRLRNQVRAGWSDIDVQLTRRHDLVPQLVKTVQAYTQHERALLTTLTALRSQAVTSERPAALAGLEAELDKALGQVFLLVEAYPDLKADQNFRQLQQDLVETENLLQYARRFYNGAVREFNDRVLQFPDLIVARLLSFTTAEFYSADDAHRENVQVSHFYNKDKQQ